MPSFLKDSIISLAVLILIHRLLLSGPNDSMADTAIGTMLLEYKESDSEDKLTSDINKNNFADEIIRIDFEANIEMGIRRKSYSIGQLYDFIRSSDQNAKASLTIFQNNANQNDLNKTVQISMNLTMPKIDRSLSQKQIILNQEKCGSPNCVFFSQIAKLEDILMTNHYLVLNTEGVVGSLEIDDKQFSFESKLYLNVYYSSNFNQTGGNSELNSLSFNLFLKEIMTNSDRDSISEIQISSYESFYNISVYIFILVSIWL